MAQTEEQRGSKKRKHESDAKGERKDSGTSKYTDKQLECFRLFGRVMDVLKTNLDDVERDGKELEDLRKARVLLDDAERVLHGDPVVFKVGDRLKRTQQGLLDTAKQFTREPETDIVYIVQKVEQRLTLGREGYGLGWQNGDLVVDSSFTNPVLERV